MFEGHVASFWGYMNIQMGMGVLRTCLGRNTCCNILVGLFNGTMMHMTMYGWDVKEF